MASTGPVPVPATASPPGSDGIPKWAYALAIGVPVTAAVAYILFGPSEDVGPKKKKKKAKSQSSPEAKAEKVQVSLSQQQTKTDPVKAEDAPEEGPETNPDASPLEKAVVAKNKGNKYFRAGRYEIAIKYYTEAIECCPPENTQDMSTFHQNRAAAYDQLENLEMVLSDCDTALNLNHKYVKALHRRASVLRKQAKKVDNFQVQVDKLKQCVEDITSVCLLEGFQNQKYVVMVDQVLRELGRAEAELAFKTNEPVLSSNHFISQYFTSFSQDPILKSIEMESEADVDETEIKEELSGFARAKKCLSEQKFETIIEDCTQEIECNGTHTQLARLLRGTFYILTKQQSNAMQDLTTLVEDETVPSKVKVNALVKRASLFIQQCNDPNKDAELSFADFTTATNIEPDNPDIYHHRGQVHLLTDEINKAIVDFNKAVTLNPDFPVAYAQKLFTDYRASVMIGDAAKAQSVLDEFEKAVERFPKCVETYALRAQVYNDQQMFSKADELYKQAFDVDPTNANLLVHRGLLAAQSTGDIDGATKLIQDALILDEKCEFAYEILGTIEVQRGNFVKGIELFDKAIPFAKTKLEMAHLYGLRDAAMAQITVSAKFGITLPTLASSS